MFAVLNPSRRGYARARGLLEADAAARGLDLAVLTTTVAEPGAGQARRALEGGAALVIAGGGDGTVRLVAGALAGSGVPLGIVPFGTANLFARNLGLRPRALQRNVATALAGRPRLVDVGWSSHRTDVSWSAEEPFLVVAVLATRPRLKRWLRWAAYFEAGLRHLGRAPLEVSVSVDEGPDRRVATWCVLAGNCGRLPAGVRVFPDARPDDGVLETLLVPLRHPWEWASVAVKGLLAPTRDVRALDYGRARTLRIVPDRPQPLQLDGDAVAGVAEARWRVAASALLVLTDPGGPR